MSELKPCPCCNGKAERTEDVFILPTSKIVYCGACGLRTKSCATWEEAEFDWNRRAQPANEPLTLEELRGMDGEPVWVHRLEDNQGWWVAIKSTERDKVTTDYGGYFEFADYGKTWLAYRRPPERSENDG